MARGSQLYGDHGYYARMEEKFQTLAVPSTTATTPRDGSSASQEGEGAFVTAAAIANAIAVNASMNTLDLMVNSINEESKAKLREVAAARDSLIIHL